MTETIVTGGIREKPDEGMAANANRQFVLKE